VRSRVMLGVLGITVLGVVSAGCSSSSTSTSGPASSGSETMTVDEATDWFGKATEVVHGCQEGSKAVGDAIQVFAASGDSGETSIPMVLAAGQAIEDCTITPDSVDQLQLFSEMEPVFPEATALAREWVDAMAVANRDVLVAAATNLDSRLFIGVGFDHQRDANAIADQFEQLIVDASTALGIAAPAGEILYHWNAPEH
jgi:hypothetical protein